MRLTACATAVISSLQAASRAKYLLEHNEIGIKEGPLILPPVGNESSPLWDLVQVFQHSVQFGLLYHLDADEHGFVVQPSSELLDLSIAGQHDYKMEPYSLSPYPKPTSAKDDEILDQLVEMYIDEEEDNEDGSDEEESRILHHLKAVGGKFWPSSSSISKLQSTTTFWVARTWNWRKTLEEFEDEFVDDPSDEMDLASCMSKKIRLTGADGVTTQQVAQITAYAPASFAKLRSKFKISEAAFMQSIFKSGPYISFQSNSKGAARAGGVFFFTRDGAYMIKTIKSQEAQTLVKILPKYYEHMRRYSRHSLLTRFCGMYKVNIRDATSRAGLSSSEEQYTFIIMNSVFPAEASQFISEMYDLKGSTVGRACSPEEKERKGRNAVLKDLDLKQEVDLVRSLQHDNTGHVSGRYGIGLGPSAKSELLAQLRKDVELLRECQVMDYSLLVGTVNMDPPSIDAADANTMELSINQERLFEAHSTQGKRRQVVISAFLTPVRLMIAPPLFFTRRLWSLTQRTMTTVLTYPLPYYGSSACGVDGGTLSVMHGTRSGKRAIYYLGLIDFLQPWTPKKVAERKIKGLMGHDITAISCVDPDEYAARFLEFIEAHVS